VGDGRARPVGLKFEAQRAETESGLQFLERW